MDVENTSQFFNISTAFLLAQRFANIPSARFPSCPPSQFTRRALLPIMASRKRPASSVALTADSTSEETSDWVVASLPPTFPLAAQVAATAAGLGAAALLSFTSETDIASRLLLKAFGPKRSLWLALKQEQAAAKATAVASAAAALQAADEDALPVTGGGAAAASGGGSDGGGGGGSEDDNDDDGDAETTTTKRLNVQEVLAREATLLNTTKLVAEKLDAAITSTKGWATEAFVNSKKRELASMTRKLNLPGMSVVVVGNTGAGKSTLINSLLGESCVLPTNGMRACTAVLIHMSYPAAEDAEQHHGVSGGARGGGGAARNRPEPHLYNGDVSFVSEKEWELELGDLMDDLTTQDGRAILSVADPKARNFTSWCKVYVRAVCTRVRVRVA